MDNSLVINALEMLKTNRPAGLVDVSPNVTSGTLK
jgi:hypothetical protein